MGWWDAALRLFSRTTKDFEPRGNSVLILHDAGNAEIQSFVQAHIEEYRRIPLADRPRVYTASLQDFLHNNNPWQRANAVEHRFADYTPANRPARPLYMNEEVNVHLIAHGYDNYPQIQVTSQVDLVGQVPPPPPLPGAAPARVREFEGNGLGQVFTQRMNHARLQVETVVLNNCYQARWFRSPVTNQWRSFARGFADTSGSANVWAETGAGTATPQRNYFGMHIGPPRLGPVEALPTSLVPAPGQPIAPSPLPPGTNVDSWAHFQPNVPDFIRYAF